VALSIYGAAFGGRGKRARAGPDGSNSRPDNRRRGRTIARGDGCVGKETTLLGQRALDGPRAVLPADTLTVLAQAWRHWQALDLGVRRHTGPGPRLDGVMHRLGIVENLNCTLDLHYTWHSPVDLAQCAAAVARFCGLWPPHPAGIPQVPHLSRAGC
jgi:hypothetical protein